jgi:hypothetical protein
MRDLRSQHWRRGLAVTWWGIRVWGLGYFLVLGLWLMPQVTKAVPSFARQTGQACTQCHVQAFGPNLTPYGREFKLNGYTTGGSLKIPPFSAMIQGSFTHTNGDQEPPPEGFGSNNNLALDEAALSYAGRILPKLGALALPWPRPQPQRLSSIAPSMGRWAVLPPI